MAKLLLKKVNLSLIKLSDESTSTELDDSDTHVVTDSDNFCADTSNLGSQYSIILPNSK